MVTLGVVACGARKVWNQDPSISGPVKAADAYVSTYARWKVRYAYRFFDRWVILSGKYGFIDPDTLIENYDVRIQQRDREDFLRQLRQQALEMDLFKDVTTVNVLGGKTYLRAVDDAISDIWDVEVISALKGKSIGASVQWMKSEVEKVDQEAVASFMRGQ